MKKDAKKVAQELLVKIEQADKQQKDGADERKIPHQAVVSLTAVITQQMPNGAWHPRATFDDQFLLILEGNSEKEVSDDLQTKLQELKEQWAKSGGQIGRYKPLEKSPTNEPATKT